MSRIEESLLLYSLADFQQWYVPQILRFPGVCRGQPTTMMSKCRGEVNQNFINGTNDTDYPPPNTHTLIPSIEPAFSEMVI